jgi:hypothetical protein
LNSEETGWSSAASSGQERAPIDDPVVNRAIREALAAIDELDVRRARDILAALIGTRE